MTEKMPKTAVKNTQNAVFTAVLSNRGIVQRFFLDNAGYEFTINQIRAAIHDRSAIFLHRKTIVNAVQEIIALDIGLQKRKDRVGRKRNHVTFYKLIKK